MKRTGFFFERFEFSGDSARPYYVYKGYELEQGVFPIALHFGRDELVFNYQDGGRVYRVFSLYTADGELNQAILTKKIQDYWKMPLWSPPENKSEDTKRDKTKEKKNDSITRNFSVDRALLAESYFSLLDDFVVTDQDRNLAFERRRLFRGRRRPEQLAIRKGALHFLYQTDTRKRSKDHEFADIWEITENGRIEAGKINFRKLLLDFLFELEYAATFEDQNFFRLQPALQNNKLLDALARKCRYLDELYKLRDYKRTGPDKKLPKKFRNAEESWLNTCFLEPYLEVFTSADSLFDTVEEEVESVFFKSRIGVIRRKRTQTFTQNDSRLRNQTATFFLRQYSLYNAFRTLLPPSVLGLIAGLMILVPTGDLIFENILKSILPEAGFFSFGLPFLALLGVIGYYAARRINLFKLMLPRMFLGIMLGWAMFWSTEESWKAALVANAGKIAVVNAVLLVLLLLYVFTDIHNKLIRVKDGAVLRRTVGVLFFAMLISFVQGFYVLQFMAEPMLENSEFLISEKLGIIDSIPDLPNEIESLEKQKNRELFGISNFYSVESFFFGKPFYYIWSVHLSQFMISILFGIVLQLLWEDRPITEPL